MTNLAKLFSFFFKLLRLESGTTSHFMGPLANYIAFVVYGLIPRPKIYG